MTLRASPLFAVTFAALAASASVAADPPPVKVCVAVAGDPDESMRAGAETVSDAVAHNPSLRGVADADARAALRGDTAPADFADLAATRRSLRGTDADATALDALSLRLGCGLVVELMARPAGAAARSYDPVRHTWMPARELSAIDANVVTTVVLPALEARNAPPVTDAGTGDAGVSDASTTTDAAVPDAGASDAGARATTVDRRVAPTPSTQQSAWSRAWPWVLVGGIALAVVGVYFLADGNTSTSTRVIVSHPGTP
jgi:hypothetical protein